MWPRTRRGVLSFACAYFRFAPYLVKRPPAAKRGREWRHHVPRGHLSSSRRARVGADLLIAVRESSRSRFVHGFTSAYSVATTNPVSTGGPRHRKRSRITSSSRRLMSQQRTGPTDGPDFPDLPEATVARLPEYLRALHHLAEEGHDTVSSEGLATAAGVNSAKLRKDLSHLGRTGTRGVGYDVSLLIEQIEHVLGLTQRRGVALVGVGNLGHALAGYAGFGNRGFRIAALFDADMGRVGERINGLIVQHIEDLATV